MRCVGYGVRVGRVWFCLGVLLWLFLFCKEVGGVFEGLCGNGVDGFAAQVGQALGDMGDECGFVTFAAHWYGCQVW